MLLWVGSASPERMKMTSRDTHDIKEYEKEQKSINVQPALLIQLLMLSEPCLFMNKNPVAVTPYQMPIQLLASYAMCCDAARQHAAEQVKFFDELFAEEDPNV